MAASEEPRIQLLDDAVINQIAAGEVVERPASVVKELLENALEAGSTRIRVEVAGGGQELIRVSDNGIGMVPEDARNCVVRHATSKLRSADDLDRVKTLGFRGEAVPSIASVSRFRLTTCPHGAERGTSVEIEGGKQLDFSECGAAPGTVVEIRDLFFNVPARRKFLKKPATELSHMTDAVLRLALAHPKVGFKLFSEGRNLLDVSENYQKDPRARLARLLGRNVAEKLHPIEDDGLDRPVKVTGFVGRPELSERTTRGYYVFVNGRFVRDKTIQHAITDAYQGRLEKGRHPVVVLYLELSPELFDVNVHPQKTEVRFAKSGEIHRAVSSAVRRTLAATPWLEEGAAAAEPQVRSYAMKAAALPLPEAEKPSLARDAEKPAAGGADAYRQRMAAAFAAAGSEIEVGKSISRFVQPPSPSFAPSRSSSSGAFRERRPSAEQSATGFSLQAPRREGPPAVSSESILPAQPQEQMPLSQAPGFVAPGFFGKLRPLAVALDKYLLCQTPNELILLSLAGVYERLAYSEIRQQERLLGQPLLIPIILEVDAARAVRLKEELDLLASLGFVLEAQEEQTFALKEAPAILQGQKLEQSLRDLLHEMMDFDQAIALSEKQELLKKQTAKNARPHSFAQLDMTGQNELLTRLAKLENPSFDLEGRSLLVRFPETMLQKMFLRPV